MAKKSKKPDSGKKTGPKPNHLKLDDDRENAITKAIKKKKPKEGWPKKSK